MAPHRPRFGVRNGPDRIGIRHSIVAGLLVHGFYLAGTSGGELRIRSRRDLSALIPRPASRS